MGSIPDYGWGPVYQLTYGGTTELHHTGTQAIRALARAVHAQPLTVGERTAFNRWYTHHKYRSVALLLRNGHRYQLRTSVAGERRLFAIDPPRRGAPQVPVTRENVTA